MTTANSATRTLQIDNMTGDACVQKVTGALKGVQGVTTQSVKMGHARIESDQPACDAACIAIGKVGYPTRENEGGDQSSTGKTSRPGVTHADAVAVDVDDAQADVRKGSATKIESDSRGGGTTRMEQDSKNGGSMGRIPMPNPAQASGKSAGPGTDGRQRS